MAKFSIEKRKAQLDEFEEMKSVSAWREFSPNYIIYIYIYIHFFFSSVAQIASKEKFARETGAQSSISLREA